MNVPDFLTSRLPLFSLRVRGKWYKDKIFQVIHGKQIIREYTDYDGSAKAHLIPFQSKFAAAVWNWQHLPYSRRRWFQSRAATLNLRISGYNYFISLYMRDKLEDFMGYPDPHHLSHEHSGADELNITNLIGSTPLALSADSVSGRVFRKSQLLLNNGTLSHSVCFTMDSVWNGDSFSAQDNMEPDCSSSLIEFDKAGNSFHILNAAFSGSIITIPSSYIWRSTTNCFYSIHGLQTGKGAYFELFHTPDGSIVSLVDIVDIGFIVFDFCYITSS